MKREAARRQDRMPKERQHRRYSQPRLQIGAAARDVVAREGIHETDRQIYRNHNDSLVYYDSPYKACFVYRLQANRCDF